MPYANLADKKASDQARYLRNRVTISAAMKVKRDERTAEQIALDRVAGTERMRQWREDNRERHLAQARNARRERRARETVIGDRHELESYIVILEHDPCVYCGAPCEHIDHINALSRGGTHEWDNLTSSCQSCNQRKGNRSLLVFLCH